MTEAVDFDMYVASPDEGVVLNQQALLEAVEVCNKDDN